MARGSLVVEVDPSAIAPLHDSPSIRNAPDRSAHPLRIVVLAAHSEQANTGKLDTTVPGIRLPFNKEADSEGECIPSVEPFDYL